MTDKQKVTLEFELTQKLSNIQEKLEAPKSQHNSFGNYKYRSCEDILNALKPFLKDFSVTVLLSDELVMIGDRYYVKATATITDGTTEISTTAYAREAEDKKGMDASQITGSASSYARKYALNGLFAIDDTKDADTKDNSDAPAAAKKVFGNKASDKQVYLINKLAEEKSIDDIKGMVMKRFNLKVFTDLTSQQASQVIEGLQAKKQETEYDVPDDF